MNDRIGSRYWYFLESSCACRAWQMDVNVPFVLPDDNDTSRAVTWFEMRRLTPANVEEAALCTLTKMSPDVTLL
jgi:hypothetical protein